MAEVFLGRRIGSGGFEKKVAIKRVLPHLAGEQAFVRMLIDEARIAAGLTHSNIIQIYELGEAEGSPFIVMEWVEGKSVSEINRRLRQNGHRMPPSVAAHLMCAACAALDHAHSRRGSDGRPLAIIHRDVSPSNLLVSCEGDVKLIDFGIARAAERLHQTKTGTIKGKYSYMSPEQVMGKTLDHRTDVFSAGIVLYELVTGQNPLQADNELEAIERARIGRVPPPSAVASAVPPALEEICLRALAVRCDDRFQRAAEMAQALDHYLRETPCSRIDLAAWLQEVFPEVDEDAVSADRETVVEVEEPAVPGTGAVTAQATVLTVEQPVAPQRRSRVSEPITAAFDRDLEEAPRTEENALERRATAPVTPVVTPRRVTRRKRRSGRQPLLYLASAVLLGAAAVAGIVLLRSSSPPSTAAAPVVSDGAQLEDVGSVPVPDTRSDSRPRDLLPLTDQLPRRGVDSARATDLASLPARRRRSPGKTVVPIRTGHGWLTVVTLHGGDDIWADVLLDGRAIGRSMLYRRRVEAGEHQVEIRRAGFRSTRKRVFIPRNQEAKLVLELVK